MTIIKGGDDYEIEQLLRESLNLYKTDQKVFFLCVNPSYYVQNSLNPQIVFVGIVYDRFNGSLHVKEIQICDNVCNESQRTCMFVEFKLETLKMDKRTPLHVLYDLKIGKNAGVYIDTLEEYGIHIFSPFKLFVGLVAWKFDDEKAVNELIKRGLFINDSNHDLRLAKEMAAMVLAHQNKIQV